MKLLLLVVVVLALVILFEVTKIAIAYERSRPLLVNTKPFERVEASASTKILVVGDSTGYGTGATLPEESVAGRLAADFPNASLENLSKNGMQIHEALQVVRGLPNGSHYSIILLQIGGNDIIYFSSREKVRSDLRLLLEEFKKHSDTVLFMSSGDVGNAPAFGPVLSFVFHNRSLSYRDIFIEESKRAEVSYVDLYQDRANDPFVKEPWVYHCVDGLHPSSAGYELWYQKLKPTLPVLNSVNKE